MPTCPSPFVYMDGGSYIMAYDPSLPLSSTNPFSTGIPTFGGGLTLMPNINGGTLTPTFYTTSGGNYYYWSGTTWVNTGHSTGSSAAVNIAGCNGTIYNLVGFTGQVYSYNGTSNGSLLTTLSGFSGGGPYDLVTDCNCNFYSLNTTSPNQALNMYSPTGSLLCTYTMTGMPNTNAGGGFAIIGNKIYVKNNVSSPGGFYVGTITGSSITFSTVSGFGQSPGDFASCPVCNPSTSLNGVTISGSAIGCNTPTTNVVVSTTVSSATYSWSGPGIVGPTTNSYITVNTQGVYSCTVSANGCPPAQITLTTNVFSNVVNVLAAMSPSGNICTQGNTPIQLSVAHSSTNDAIVWTGSNISPVNATDSLLAIQPGSYTVTVTDLFSGCSGTSAVNIIPTPTLSLALSDNTVCLFGYNGSPNSITLTPSGASNYTLLTSTNYSTNNPFGNTFPVYPVTINGNFSSLATATLIGANSICADTISSSFSILPNPTLALSPANASICPYQTQLFTVNGANNYVWGGAAGLNTYIGAIVVASPTTSSIYTVVGNNNSCMSATSSVSLTILPIPSLLINPSTTTICKGNSVNLSAIGTASAFTWYPASGLISNVGAIVNASPQNSQVYTVIGSLNTCTNSASATVIVVPPPVLSIALSQPTLCAEGFNNSPTTITLTPNGAQSHTLSASGGVILNNPSSAVILASSVGTAITAPVIVTATMTGESGVCTASVTKTFTIIPNPVLTILPSNASICPDQSQTFVASGVNTYNWLPMPGYTLTAPNTIHAKPNLTSFYPVYGNTSGCFSATKNAVLVVQPIPIVNASASTPTICFGRTLTLTASGDGQLYNWYPASELQFPFGSQVTAKPNSTQIFTVIASLNSCTNSAITTVSVIPIPVISASAEQQTICSSGMTNIKATGAISYEWLPKNYLNTNIGNVVIARPDASTTFTIQGYNGTCTGSTQITIVTVKRPDVELFSESNTICKGGSIPITAKGAETFSWFPIQGILTPPSGSMVVLGPNATTNYTVIGSTSIGSVTCTQLLSYSVIVVPEIKPFVSENVSICQGQKTLLSAWGSNTYTWSPSYGLNITNQAKVVANPSVSTMYTVEVSDHTYCGVTTTVMVDVNPVPKVFAGRDTTYNLSDPIFINAEGTGTLSWVSGEDILCKDCPYTQIYPTRSGCYVAQAENTFGCLATDDICINLTEEFSIYIPNSFTPNNDGLNDQFLIYGEYIYDVTMQIYDRWGLLIFQSNDAKQGWDGTYKGKKCAVDTYTYKISYTGLNRKKYTRVGHVFIIK